MAKAPAQPRMNAQERQWRAQDALSTLTRADAIRADKGLMRDVQAHAKRQVETLSRVAAPKAAPRRGK